MNHSSCVPLLLLKTAMLKNLRMQNGACKTAFGFFKLKITSYFKVLSLAPIAWNSKP